MKTRLNARLAWLAILTLGMVAGCGYRLGSSLPPNLRTVHIPTFVNQTTEPLIEVDLTAATLEEMQRDGTLRIKSAAEADATLQVKLTGFVMDPMRYEKDRVTTAKEYRMRVRAELRMIRTTNQEVLMQRTVEGYAIFPAPGDLTSAKKTALPSLAKDLAHRIVESVVEFW